jgi:hypothetical protein
VVHVTNRPHIAMRLRPFKLFLGHETLRFTLSVVPADQANFA